MLGVVEVLQEGVAVCNAVEVGCFESASKQVRKGVSVERRKRTEFDVGAPLDGENVFGFLTCVESEGNRTGDMWLNLSNQRFDKHQFNAGCFECWPRNDVAGAVFYDGCGMAQDVGGTFLFVVEHNIGKFLA